MQARDIGTPQVFPARRAKDVEQATTIVMASGKTGSSVVSASRREVLWGVLEIGDIDLGFDDALSFEISPRSRIDTNRNRLVSDINTSDTNSYADRSHGVADHPGQQVALPNRRNSND